MSESFLALREEYDKVLRQTIEALEKRLLKESALIMRAWRKELGTTECGIAMCEHIRRTLRSLGGMESIGDYALSHSDQELLSLLDHLTGVCKRLTSLCCGHSAGDPGLDDLSKPH